MGRVQSCRCADEGELAEDERYADLDAVLSEHEGDAASLIQILHRTQNLFGYCPRRAQSRIARALGLTEATVEGVVSFYHYFTRVPRGRHTVRVCMGTACYVRGGQKIVAELEKGLGIRVGGTTEDREFSLETVRCLGACGLAPVMMVDDDVFRCVQPNEAMGLLDRYRRDEQ